MATHALADVLRYMRRLVAAEEGDEPGDAPLLRRFVARRDEAAFAALLERHAPLVFGVCRQVLGNRHDAEDAFQATFLVLARKAGSVRRGQSLSAWLYRVALNVARTARARAARRQAHEREAALMPEPTAADQAAPRDWQPILHEEVDRLPEKYRVPVVLCYLQAKTHDEAARQLGWPLGTVKGRLARARDLLRSRLARRGLSLSAGALATAWTAGPATAAVPPALLAATFRAAVSFARQAAVPGGAASANAVTLAQGVLRTMNGTTTRLVLLFLLVLGAAGAGAVFAARPGDGADAAGPPVRGTPAGAPRAGEAQKSRPAGGGPLLTLRSERQEYRPGEPIDLLLGVTNPGKEDFNCLNPPLNILANLEVTGPDGKKVAAVLNPPAAIAALPAQSAFEIGTFIVGPGQTAWVSDCLRWINRAKAETGTYIRRGYYPMEAAGTYRLRIRLGKAASNELVLKVLGNEGLAESPAVRVNQVDFQTVVEEKCRQPAPGGKQPLYLGLRVTNRGDGPLRFNLYDTLRPVLMTGDGKMVPIKAGQRLRSFVPAPLLARPGKTETVLRCPFLEWLPDGKTLRLRGPDGAGGFWYCNGLRPGKYRVRFEYENTEATQAALLRTLREQAGAGPPFWLGKVVTREAAFEIIRPAEPGKGVQDLPAGLQASEPAAEKGLEFQVLSDRVWPVPGPGGFSPLPLQLRVSNRAKEAVRFVPILGTPVLKTAGGERLKPRLHGRDHIRRLPDAVLLEPGKAAGATELARLFGGDKGLSLYWEDETGDNWSYDGLQPGAYRLSLHYHSKGPGGTWDGDVTTNEVTVVIRELRASAPVVANQLQVCALADGIWQAPAAGKRAVIALGFRVTKVQGPTWARIIPRIAAVSITAPDGAELPVKKVATGLPGRQPQALHMNPDVSRTLAEPATLSRAGGALALTWMDSTGDAWRIAGLRPGTYRVRYLIRADSGKAPGDWTTWTGEVRTAAVEVTIRE